jgi:pantetheine-phosphate adenylyltransferase
VKALYPGSFDPPHHGHIDVIRRAAKVCDQLVVAIAGNPEKKPYLPTMSRVEILRAECAALRNVEVLQYTGATVTWAKANGINALVRGLRTASDLENEAPMAAIHRSHGFETLFLVCDPALSHISSRMIRSVLAAGLPTDALMSGRTLDAIRRWSAP